MSDDGPTYDSIVASSLRVLTSNGAPCLWGMLVMEFGLCNAPTNIFTRLMTHVLDPFIHLIVIVYLDDCIFSKSAKDHINHLRHALTILGQNKVFINMVK